ncbi:ribosomal protein S18-alanine N-acetyltransferase [Lachnospiraceae bacterium ZAX-1]
MELLTLRRMLPIDVKAVRELEALIFTDPWSEQGFYDAVNQNNVLFAIAEVHRTIVGYCGMYCAFDEGEITNVAVAPTDRQKGIAGKLVAYLLETAKEMKIHQIVLEVRISNIHAIHLYEKLGFKKEGIRQNFYTLPKEDAYVMILHQ